MESFYLFICLLVVFGFWTQGLELARQALYYLSHACSPFAFSLFSDTVSLLPGWPRFLLLSSKNYRCEPPWSGRDSISTVKWAEYFLFSPTVPASLWVHHGDSRWTFLKHCSLGVWSWVPCTSKPVIVLSQSLSIIHFLFLSLYPFIKG